MSKRITVGVPTYNRSEIVLQNFLKLKNVCENLNLDLLIIDNGSAQNEQLKMKSFFVKLGFTNFHMYKNNSGFHESFSRIILHTRTPFILFLSDEDILIEKNFYQIQDFIDQFNPGVMLPLRNNEKSVNFKTVFKKASPRQMVFATTYISGIVFETKVAQAKISVLESKLRNEIFWQLYPHLVLLYVLSCVKKAYTYNPITIQHVFDARIFKFKRKKRKLQASIEPYWLPTPRVLQHGSHIRCIHLLKTLVTDASSRRLMDKVENVVKKSFFGRMQDSIMITDIIALDAYKQISLKFFLSNVKYQINKLNIFK